MQGNSSVEKNLKDFEALLEKCKCRAMQTRTTLRLFPSSTR
jgi:hypothetical protein